MIKQDIKITAAADHVEAVMNELSPEQYFAFASTVLGQAFIAVINARTEEKAVQFKPKPCPWALMHRASKKEIVLGEHIKTKNGEKVKVKAFFPPLNGVYGQCNEAGTGKVLVEYVDGADEGWRQQLRPSAIGAYFIKRSD